MKAEAPVSEQVLAYCAQRARFRSAINKYIGRVADIGALVQRGFLVVDCEKSFHAVNMKKYRTTAAGAQWALERLQARRQQNLGACS